MTRSDRQLSCATAFRLAIAFSAVIFLLSAFTVQIMQAQTFTVLHQFTGGVDGANPAAGLTLDRTGRLFGTSSGSAQGTNGTGFTVANLHSNWLLNPLYEFTQSNHGLYPNTRLIQGSDGAFYGTTWKGGNAGCGGQGCGVVFKLQPPATIACRAAFCPWTETVLYAFNGGVDGSTPGPVVLDAAGNIYGNTYYGGSAACQCGTVYQLKFSAGVWSKTTLHSFDITSGANPDGPLVVDQLGNVYGTAVSGGGNNDGAVYEVSPSGQSWTQTVLHNFQGSDGVYPNGGLIADASGDLYGVAAAGGGNGVGTVFSLTQPGNWTFQTLYNFKSPVSGSSPHGPLVFDRAGSLYGVTENGRFDEGTVFKLTFANQTWTATDLHDFNGSDGDFPNPGLVIDVVGNIYGTAMGDSLHDNCYPTGCGDIWQISQ